MSLGSSTEGIPGSGPLTTRPEAGNVDAVAMVDVMFDQLEYLVMHNGPQCPAGCPECARLEQVKNWLLRPFGAGDPAPSLTGRVSEAPQPTA